MRRVIFCLMGLLSGCEEPGLGVCDQVIKSKLKAPASYVRLKADGSAISRSVGRWEIEYDAVNSFNAPIRGRGTCYMIDGKVSWSEKYDPPSE